MDQNDYMAQQDDWDREGLLDPAWERQQKKVSSFLPLQIQLASAFACFKTGIYEHITRCECNVMRGVCVVYALGRVNDSQHSVQPRASSIHLDCAKLF